MKYVEIYKLQNDGSQKVLATCVLQKDTIVCSGEEIFVNNLLKEGISDYSQTSSKKLFPKDGVHFLEQLKYNFKSGYLTASEIKDDGNE